MTANLAIGTLLVSLTVLIQTIGLVILSRLTPLIAQKFRLQSHDIGRGLIMMLSVLGIFVVHTVEIWMWAFAYDQLGVTVGFQNALDISTAMFSTVGYGPVPIAPDWRLLAALEGINGFILIGWSAAYLVGVATRHGPFRKGEHF